MLRVGIMRRQSVSSSKRRGSFHRTVDCGGCGNYYRRGQMTTFINNAIAQTKKNMEYKEKQIVAKMRLETKQKASHIVAWSTRIILELF